MSSFLYRTENRSWVQRLTRPNRQQRRLRRRVLLLDARQAAGPRLMGCSFEGCICGTPATGGGGRLFQEFGGLAFFRD